MDYRLIFFYGEIIFASIKFSLDNKENLFYYTSSFKITKLSSYEKITNPKL